MEKDCLVAHGAGKVLLDRLFHQSDEFPCDVCRRCGLLAERNKEDAAGVAVETTFCRGCRQRGRENVARVHIPCSLKVLHQELAALGVCTRFRVADPPASKDSF